MEVMECHTFKPQDGELDYTKVKFPLDSACTGDLKCSTDRSIIRTHPYMENLYSCGVAGPFLVFLLVAPDE